MGNACYYPFEKILSPRLLTKKLQVNTYKTIISIYQLYGFETWSLTLREGQRLRVFDNNVLRKIFGAGREMKLLESGESYIMLSYMHYILRLT